MAARETLRRALAALDREVLSFRFEYPLEIVAAAAEPGSLRYHVFSESLFLEHQEFDSSGVPLKNYRLLGPRYNPLFVAWWGLHHLERAARGGRGADLDVFWHQIHWLCERAVRRSDGSAVWLCDFDWCEGRTRLRSPWISAMYQGVAISALVRAARLAGSDELLELARAAAGPFRTMVADGGVRSREGGATLYEEYPALPLPRILDGFLFSLVGLHDLARASGDPAIQRLFDEGVEGLVRNLPWWDYRGKWSWYGAHGYLCPPHYHALNHGLVALLGRLTGEPSLARQARQWDPAGHSLRDRAEIFAVLLASQNLARLRLPNERGA